MVEVSRPMNEAQTQLNLKRIAEELGYRIK